MDAIKNFFKTFSGYFKKDNSAPAAAAQPEGEAGEQQPRNLDNMKQSRVKPSGSGLNKKICYRGLRHCAHPCHVQYDAGRRQGRQPYQ